MFKVKNKDTGAISTVLDVYLDNIFATTFFLIWENDGWRWRNAENYVPPNYEVKGGVSNENKLSQLWSSN